VPSRSQGRREPDCIACITGYERKKNLHQRQEVRGGRLARCTYSSDTQGAEPLAGDPPEDAPVRHARVRAAAGGVERQALGPRGAGVHGDQLDAAVPGAVVATAYLQHRDVAPGVRGEDRIAAAASTASTVIFIGCAWTIDRENIVVAACGRGRCFPVLPPENAGRVRWFGANPSV
jgi:hypothetical protein